MSRYWYNRFCSHAGDVERTLEELDANGVNMAEVKVVTVNAVHACKHEESSETYRIFFPGEEK